MVVLLLFCLFMMKGVIGTSPPFTSPTRAPSMTPSPLTLSTSNPIMTPTTMTLSPITQPSIMTPNTSPTASTTSTPSIMTPTTMTPSIMTPSPTASNGYVITTIAGTGSAGSGSDGVAATSTTLFGPYGVNVDSSGNVYIADTSNSRIRKVTVSTGIITTFAGTGTATFTGDSGQATSAGLSFPEGLVLDSAGNAYIADTNNNRIRKVTTTGVISTIAGSSIFGGFGGDGEAATSDSVQLNYPSTVALDASGNVFIADQYNHRIRKVTISTGIISTIAGSSTIGGFYGDEGAATSAILNYPFGITLDSAKDVYISDTSNNRIRKVTISTGIITTIAGTGDGSYLGDNGAATSATIYLPHAISLDSSGNLFIADSFNQRIRKVDTSGVITTIAGSSSSGGYNGDNIAATSATLQSPNGVAVDSTGNVYIAEYSNNRIRKVAASISSPSTIPSRTPTTSTPSNSPSIIPTRIPSKTPTTSPSTSPTTAKPSFNPSLIPTMTPSKTPTTSPSTSLTTAKPSFIPSVIPTMMPSKTPTTSPSTSPTALQTSSNPSVIPTRMPSYVPSLAPSTYPTYTSIAHVYFLATHGLLGVNASVYLNNEASNDAVFMQTVASVIGYDSNVYDVRILSVTDSFSLPTTTSSRSLATSVGMIMKYSVTTSSRVFNSTNLAITRFMQSLNASVLTGEFDALLHSNADTKGATDLLGVYTDYIILTTASPTSSPTSTPISTPTSTPTSSPTKKDIVAANLLEVPLDSEVARVKVKYYLGAFVGYFLTIYICLYLYSLLRYGNITARKLYHAAYQSEEYIRSSAITGENMSNVSILSDLYMKNILVQSAIRADDELKQVKKTAPRIETDDKDDVKNKYSKGYREYVDQRRTLLGCSACLYPDGCEVKVPCRSSEIVFPPGRVENILLYICHNHPLFSCFYFMDGSKLGAHGTRILYIGKFIVVFVMYQFSNMLLQYLMLDGHGLGTLINLFIITPSAMSVGLLLKYLYTCPFTETVEFQRKYAKYQTLVLFFGRLAIVPIMFIMCISLFFACLFSSGHRIPAILIKFFFNVQLYGVLLEVVKAALLFVDNYYYQVSLFGVLDIICIGKLYKERIMAEQQVVGVDYAYRIHNYLFGLIKVQKILNRDDAIKSKWITVGADDQYDVEMKGDDRSGGFVVQNPLALAHVTTNAAVIPEQDDAEREYITHNIPFSNALPIVSEHVLTHHSEPLHIQHIITVKEEKVVEDDATLYLEYQSLQSQHDKAVFDTNSNDDVGISFEEWKSKRKQFKQGTRGSFVKAFQMFEEREQLARDHLDHSASVANAMHLYKGNNVLAKKGHVRPK